MAKKANYTQGRETSLSLLIFPRLVALLHTVNSWKLENEKVRSSNNSSKSIMTRRSDELRRWTQAGALHIGRVYVTPRASLSHSQSQSLSQSQGHPRDSSEPPGVRAHSGMQKCCHDYFPGNSQCTCLHCNIWYLHSELHVHIINAYLTSEWWMWMTLNS